jgi:hypothetical protein
MTKRQIQKLQTIIAKLEALQATIGNGPVSDYLSDAKTELIRALRAVP